MRLPTVCAAGCQALRDATPTLGGAPNGKSGRKEGVRRTPASRASVAFACRCLWYVDVLPEAQVVQTLHRSLGQVPTFASSASTDGPVVICSKGT